MAVTVIAPDGKDITPGFRECAWQLLLKYLKYLDYLRILEGQQNPKEFVSDTERRHIQQSNCEYELAFYNQVCNLENEFCRLGLMRQWPIETVGITLIRLYLDGQEMYVRTLSTHWWRFVCEQLKLPFPLVLGMIPPHGPESYFESN